MLHPMELRLCTGLTGQVWMVLCGIDIGETRGEQETERRDDERKRAFFGQLKQPLPYQSQGSRPFAPSDDDVRRDA
ncbi:hypothetical protein CCHR01_13603 [Colletotrichum chrysophilum]|uniref:Uncharacterized protein n=1 Tax=Colletotrichum chrysophilum TaxID=1836956 RepID=A0AAD9A966_9PEZI|nr:hypothetical protein CCHR01_13603 [Colletotrichum chrysophilum]